MNIKILSVGEIIWDIYENKKVIGGAPLNFAAHCAMLGAQSTLVSAIGNDVLAQPAFSEIEKYGIKTAFFKTADLPTGQCIVTLDKTGVPSYRVLENVAYDAIEITDSDIEKINAAEYDAFYFGTLIQRSKKSRDAIRKIVGNCRFSHIVCDINLRENCYDDDSVKFCLKSATILKISSEEEPILRKMGFYDSDGSEISAAQALCEKYGQLQYVIITLGGDGAFAYRAYDGKEFRIGAEKTEVISTVGAGDSFCAAWVCSFLGGDSIETAMKKAADLSGFVVSQREAVPRRKGLPLADMHIHTATSHDGSGTVAEMAQMQLQNGNFAFAVTEHCDTLYYDDEFFWKRLEKSKNEVEAVKKKFDGQIKVLFGTEIGECVDYPEITKKVFEKYSFDVVVGSVHTVRFKGGYTPYSQIDFSKFTKTDIKQFLEAYFEALLKTAKTLDFDILAHLTCPLRYINGKYSMNFDASVFDEKIKEILSVIIRRNIALEINTSGADDEVTGFMPPKKAVKMYRDMGGTLVTLGSDAHTAQNAAKMFDEAVKMLKSCGFDSLCYFENRQCIKYKI